MTKKKNPILGMRADIRAGIKRSGFFAIHVAADPESKSPRFAYTIGLREQGLPELIVFAIPPEYAHPILWNAIEVMRAKGVPADGDQSDEISNLPTSFRAVDPERACAEHLTAARSYYGSLPPSVMQLVWPDQAGRFPWQEGADKTIHRLQAGLVDWTKGAH